MADALTGWFPVVTLILGYCLKVVFDWVQHKRTVEREREAREAERRRQLAGRRTEFQRQTLLDLQETLMELARATGAVYHQDTMVYLSTGQWRKQLLGEPLNEKHNLAVRRTTMLSVRVLDDSVRTLVEKCKTQAIQIVISTSKEQSDAAFAEMVSSFEQGNQRKGELLRKIDDAKSE